MGGSGWRAPVTNFIAAALLHCGIASRTQQYVGNTLSWSVWVSSLQRVCVFMCVYVYMYVCSCMCMIVYICVCSCMCICMCAQARAHVCVRVCREGEEEVGLHGLQFLVAAKFSHSSTALTRGCGRGLVRCPVLVAVRGISHGLIWQAHLGSAAGVLIAAADMGLHSPTGKVPSPHSGANLRFGGWHASGFASERRGPTTSVEKERRAAVPQRVSRKNGALRSHNECRARTARCWGAPW